MPADGYRCPRCGCALLPDDADAETGSCELCVQETAEDGAGEC